MYFVESPALSEAGPGGARGYRPVGAGCADAGFRVVRVLRRADGLRRPNGPRHDAAHGFLRDARGNPDGSSAAAGVSIVVVNWHNAI